MVPASFAFVPLMGSPESVSFGLLIIFAAVLLVTILSVISAVFDMMVYAGGAALVVGAIFYLSDSLSLGAALEFLAHLVGLA